MDLSTFIATPDEKPLDRLVTNGGLCPIFRTIACIGDSLSSGEFESTNEEGKKGYHDYFEYSWGQYIAREAGLKCYNFSKGGMTARQYRQSFGDAKCCWDGEKRSQAYIIALGVNDLCNQGHELGSIADINMDDYNKNPDTFAGNYAYIIQRYKKMQPKARFFLVTMPLGMYADRNEKIHQHNKLLHEMAELFEYTYVIDLTKYAPVYDEEFRRNFYLGGHMNAAGYLFTARMIMSYIDYIIRNNPEDFAQIGFVGTPYHNRTAKW